MTDPYGSEIIFILFEIALAINQTGRIVISMNKTAEQYEENLSEGFGSLSLVGEKEYENIKAKLISFCAENQVQFAMAQGLLNAICVSLKDKRKNLNKCLSKISVFKEGVTRIVTYSNGQFSYEVK